MNYPLEILSEALEYLFWFHMGFTSGVQWLSVCKHKLQKWWLFCDAPSDCLRRDTAFETPSCWRQVTFGYDC